MAKKAAAWKPVSVGSVTLSGGLLAERQAVVLEKSIDYQYHQCKTTGRIDAWKLAWKEGATEVPKPHQFWDSDVAKWIESAAYGLSLKKDPELEAQVDGVIDMMAAAQAPDGYLNSFYQAVKPEKRFTNLRDDHELYCAGHLMEAAVAYYEATGKRKMLDVLSRYADLIGEVFGPGEGQKRGYDGHEEVELGLVKLYGATGEKRYLELAKFFVDERGKQPHFYDEEAKARGDDPKKYWAGGDYGYLQAHVPVREQGTAEGHSVRAMYLFAGVADVARETKDAGLMRACRRVFDNVVNRRMYITGGIGSTRHGERFTYDFDLPNESAYAETCASIALIFFARRMLDMERDGRYADVIEQALYNGVLSGISLDGTKYFYANYLATDGKWHQFEKGYPPYREGWFGCACCPPNLARLLASIGSYAYSAAGNEVAVHMYLDSSVELKELGVELVQETTYPREGDVAFTVAAEKPTAFTLHLRIPAWAGKAQLWVNGKKTAVKPVKGYVSVSRTWADGDQVVLSLPMEARRVYASPRVQDNSGRVALMRGPVVYCLESKDNGADLGALLLPKAAKVGAKSAPRLLGGVMTLEAGGLREVPVTDALYSEKRPKAKPAKLTAVPYYAWNNRGNGELTVWIRER